MSCGCCGENNDNKNKEVNYIECPECGSSAQSVPHAVLKSLVNKELKDEILENDYYICLNPDCENVYIDETKNSVFQLKDLKKPIWFKRGSKPKIACYCNNITYKQVKKAVRKLDLKNWEDIVLNYKNKAICMCERLNPTGECCSDNFYKVVNTVLKKEGKPLVDSSSGSCCG